MKLKIYFIAVVILILTVNCFSQQLNSEQAVKFTLEKLFDLSKNENFTEAASLIAYTGKDKNRKYHDTLNPNEKLEFYRAKRICLQISALIDLSKHEIGNYSTNKIDNIIFHCLEVHFLSSEQGIVKNFNFIKINNKYLLTFIE